MNKNKEFLEELKCFIVRNVNEANVNDFIEGLSKIIEDCLIVPKQNIVENVYFLSDDNPCAGGHYINISAHFATRADKHIEYNPVSKLFGVQLMEERYKQELIQSIFDKLEENQ